MLTINTCTTVKEYVKVQYILPPFPEREEIILPDNPVLSDYAEIILYYDTLVQKWEVWGKTVKKILDTK